jgi:hypothetical protein
MSTIGALADEKKSAGAPFFGHGMRKCARRKNSKHEIRNSKQIRMPKSTKSEREFSEFKE